MSMAGLVSIFHTFRCTFRVFLDHGQSSVGSEKGGELLKTIVDVVKNEKIPMNNWNMAVE